MKETMLAARVYGQNDLRLEQMPVPKVLPGSILIRVESCAICGTDLRIYQKGDYRAAYPVTTGHEIAATVVETAPGVTAVRVGDRVCVAPGHGCGNCRMCLSGQPNVCLTPHPSLGISWTEGLRNTWPSRSTFSGWDLSIASRMNLTSIRLPCPRSSPVA